jgi:hypothetical protein
MNIRIFVPVFGLLALLTACPAKDEAQKAAKPSTVTETASRTDPSTVDLSEAKQAKTLSTAMTTVAFPVDGSIIEIDFSGAISHILRTDGKPMRSVLIADAGHKAKLIIFKPTMVAATDAESQTAIATAIGGSPSVVCDRKSCIVKNLPPLSIRILDAADKPMTGTLTPGPDFDYLVPHMKTAAGVTKLDPNLEEGAPKGDFTTFFELNGGGTFSARPYCTAVGLDPDLETRPNRLFASKTTLRGVTDKPARLEFSDDGTSWRPLALLDGKYILLSISNDPTDAVSHFHLHEKIADGSVANYPKLKAEVTDCVVSTAVGCGNTQWP